MIRRIKRLIRERVQWRLLIKAEMDRPVPLPWRTRLWCWAHGFTTRSYNLYRLGQNDPSLYLSDYARFIRTPWIDGTFGVALDDKLMFRDLLSAFPGVTPTYYARLRNGQILGLDTTAPVHSFADILALLRSGKRLVSKPVDGGYALDVCMLDYGPAYRVNGQEVTEAALLERMAHWRNHLVTEYLETAAYCRRIFPAGSSTLRMITMWDPVAGEPFMPVAVHRFSTSKVQPVDAFGRGGVSAWINLETGRMERAVQPDLRGNTTWLTHHPDTGEPITGVEITHWAEARDLVLRLARRFVYLPYVAWDVLITDQGVRIIEGNRYSGMDLVQVHQPLLADPRVRRFYAHHGVISHT